MTSNGAAPQDQVLSLAKVTDAYGVTVHVAKYVRTGSTGLVYQGKYGAGPYNVAIKFFVPVPAYLFNLASSMTFAIGPKGPDEARYRHEIESLREIRHINLQEYVGHGELLYDKPYFKGDGVTLAHGPDCKVPFLVTRFVDGDELDKYLSASLTRENVINVLTGIADGLVEIHNKGILHRDLTLHNIIVDKSGTPVLVDFGFSKRLIEHAAENTSLAINPDSLPEPIRYLLKSLTAPNGPTGTYDTDLLYGLLFPWADLYCYGLLLRRVIDKCADHLTESDVEFLSLLERTLVNWVPIESAEFPKSTIDGPIKDATSLRAHLERLAVGGAYYERAFLRSEKMPSRTIVQAQSTLEVRDSIAPLLGHSALRRLHNLKQLSLIHYIYPSAGQTRFDHVLSSLGMTQRFWRSLANRPAFLFHMDQESINRLEVVALCHDLNHFPFLHYFQEAGATDIAAVSVLEVFKKENTSFFNTLQNQGVSLDYLRYILLEEPLATDKPSDQIIKSIINSGIDVDKLSYLRDDSYFTGVPFGSGIDLHGLLANIDIANIIDHRPQKAVDTESKKRPAAKDIWHIVFTRDALPAIESVCFARYWNFQRIYWHHVNRAMASMIIWTIRRLFSGPEGNVEQYLIDTAGEGESGSLQYLAKQYKTKFNDSSPIDNLASSRDGIYKTVYEASIGEASGYDKGEQESGMRALSALRNADVNRENARKRVLEEVESLVKRSIQDVRDDEVLLDVPLREMDLGGPIYIRESSGSIVPVIQLSPVLNELSTKFSDLSKTIRVFVSPRIREAIRGNEYVTTIVKQALFPKTSKVSEFR